MIARKTQEDAIHVMALNEIKADRAAERAKAVFDDYNSVESLASSSDYVFRVLSNPKNLQAELANLEADIRILDESMQEEGLTKDERASLRKEWKEKNKEIELLGKWTGFWSSREEITENLDSETGAKQVSREAVLDAFIGRKAPKKAKVKQEDGSVKEEEVFETHHKDVKKLFKELINLKNKQAGLDARVYLKDMESGFDKVVDFIQLEQDAKDYMESVESLFSPETYQATVARMQDGKFKSKLMEYADSMEYRIAYTVAEILKSSGELEITLDKNGRPMVLFTGDITPDQFQEVRDRIIEKVTESEAFENIMNVILDKELGLAQSKYIQEQMKKIDEVLKSQLKEELQEYVPEFQFDEPISNEVYKKFNEDNEAVDKTVLDSIAKRIAETNSGVDGLSPRQKAIYERHSGKIDHEVVKLKKQDSKKEEKEVTQQPASEAQEVKETTEVEEGAPLTGTETPGDIPTLEEENADDLLEKQKQEPKGEYSLKWNSINAEIQVLVNLAAQGNTTTEDGKNIDDEIARLAGELEALDAQFSKPAVEQTEETDPNAVSDEQFEELKEDNKLTEEEKESPEGDVVYEETEEGPFDLHDEDGSFLGSYLTREDRDAADARHKQNKENARFVRDLIKKVTPSKVKESMVIQLTQRLMRVMDTHNQTREKGGEYKSLESFYNSSKIVELTIFNELVGYVDVNPDLILNDQEVEVKEVFSSPKSKQDVSQVIEETQSQQFNQAVTDLHSRLKDTSMPTTAEQTGEIGVVFPEGTTDFTNFVKNVPTEENALNQLKEIKFSCKK
jgi:hypothetical protein